jgi:hypothetical protein
MISVQLPVITLSNEGASADGYLVDLPGWYDTAEVRQRNTPRNDAHGDFDQEPVYDDSLYFSIVGKIIAPGNPAAMFTLRDTLMQLKQITGQWAATVTDITGEWTRYVRLAGQIRFTIMDEPAGWAEFAIPVKAKDPRKYGPELAPSAGLPSASGGIAFPITFPVTFGASGDSGRVVTLNTGGATTYATLEVSGGLAGGFSAVCTELGREVRLERQIPLGSTVTVNLRTGQAFIDDQSPVTGSLTRREWWDNPPGQTRTIQFNSIGAVTGTPTLTVRYQPASN